MNQQMTKKERIEYIDVLRVISMLSVVFMHTAAGSLRGNIGSLTWHVSNVLTSIMCTSVPIFFMISGAMLMSSKKTESIQYMYKNRFPKVFVPFVIWSFAAILYFILLKYIFTGVIDKEIAAQKIKNIMSQATTVHLWFMYALIPMYILSPLLKKLVDSLNRSLAGYMLILWLIFSSVLPTIAVFVPENYKSFFTLNNDFNLNFIGGYLGYFLLGYYLFKLDKKLSKKLLIIIIVIDTAIISLGTWYFTLKLGTYPEHFLSYPKIFMLVLSASVFLLVKELLSDKHLHGPVLSIINFLASISFGVYLLHNLIVDFISNIINLWPASSLFNLVLCYFIVLIASFLCIIVLASFKPTCFIFTGLTYDAACKTCNIQFLIRSTVKKLDTARNK